jgi:hypothetical protein
LGICRAQSGCPSPDLNFKQPTWQKIRNRHHRA